MHKAVIALAIMAVSGAAQAKPVHAQHLPGFADTG